MFVVRIIETSTNRIEKEFSPQFHKRAAERIEDGVNINLNHERFHTEIFEKTAPAQKGGGDD